MRVTMQKTMPGSEDGIRVQEYVEGETYDLGAELALSFIGSKCATPAKEETQEGNHNKEGSSDSDSTAGDGRMAKSKKGPTENK